MAINVVLVSKDKDRWVVAYNGWSGSSPKIYDGGLEDGEESGVKLVTETGTFQGKKQGKIRIEAADWQPGNVKPANPNAWKYKNTYVIEEEDVNPLLVDNDLFGERKERSEA